ncbi:DsbA family protein [Labilithrix luteola]|nr:DsbA family protein [Labilithrix luteola]
MTMLRTGLALFASLASLASLATLLAACGASVPAGIRDEMARSPKDTATVVVFTDFQCPFCRRTHAKLEEALEARPNVRVVVRHVPLRSHPDARTAAKTAICAEKLLPPSAATATTDALFRSSDLSEATCMDFVVKLGASADDVRACLNAPATEERLAQDEALYVAAEGDGVPLLYVGNQRVDGEPSKAALAAALDKAGARAHSGSQ